MIQLDSLIRDLNLIREKSPLIHNITNYVVMNNTANALLAIGASPVMAHAREEVEEMASIASALVINIGTLEPVWVEAMIMAGKKAKEKGTPVIFDPVGAGATSYRNEVCKQIIAECRPDIIRGNASEIIALYTAQNQTKGVDSTASSEEALESAKKLAEQLNTVIVISGATDYITDGKVVELVRNGHPLMPRVTGMGCTATAIVAAFAAVNPDYLQAATHAMAIMGVAGEIAAKQAKGPGTMQLFFLDELANLDEETVQMTLK